LRESFGKTLSPLSRVYRSLCSHSRGKYRGYHGITAIPMPCQTLVAMATPVA